MKYFIYCRRSSTETEDKQVLSLPAQRKELTDYANKENLTVIDIYEESQTAHKIGRPKFNEMLNRIEKKEAQGFIVWDESRIARNSMDGGKVIYMLDEDVIKEIRKPGKSFRNTPDDKSWLGMILTMTKKDSDDKGVNVARGLRTKAEQGWFPSSWTKPGYIWDKQAERGNKTILKDPDRFHLIKQAWELMITGTYTPPQILKIMNKDWKYKTLQRKSIGGGEMQRSTIYKIFTDPFYYGEYNYPDKEGNLITYTGSHEAMITKEEFERVQILLGRNGKPRPKTHNFPFTGIMRCGECKAMVTAEEKWQIICPDCRLKFSSLNKTSCPKCSILIEDMTKPTLLHYQYYHCTKKKKIICKQKSIKIKKLEEQIDVLLGKIEISDRFKDWAIKYLNELNEQERNNRNEIISNLQKTYDGCVVRLDNLIKLKISPNNTDGSLLSDDDFKAQKTALMTERKGIEEKIKNQGIRLDNWIELAEKAFNFACHARFWFANGDVQTKKEIVSALGQNLLLFNGIVLVDLEKPLNFIEEAKKEYEQILNISEPKKKVDLTAKVEHLWAENLTLLPRKGSNLEPSR